MIDDEDDDCGGDLSYSLSKEKLSLNK